MEDKIKKSLEDLTTEQTEKLLGENMEMKISAAEKNRIKNAVFDKAGFTKQKRVYIPRSFIACAAAVALVIGTLAIGGVDNVTAAIKNAFTFIPGVEIAVADAADIYTIEPIVEKVKSDKGEATISNALYSDGYLTATVNVEGKGISSKTLSGTGFSFDDLSLYINGDLLKPNIESPEDAPSAAVVESYLGEQSESLSTIGGTGDGAQVAPSVESGEVGTQGMDGNFSIDKSFTVGDDDDSEGVRTYTIESQGTEEGSVSMGDGENPHAISGGSGDAVDTGSDVRIVSNEASAVAPLPAAGGSVDLEDSNSDARIAPEVSVGSMPADDPRVTVIAGSEDSSVAIVSYKMETPKEGDVYEIAIAGFDDRLSFKMVPCRSYEDVTEIGPTDTQNNISLTATAQRSDDQLVVWLYPFKGAGAPKDTITMIGEDDHWVLEEHKYIETGSGKVFGEDAGMSGMNRTTFDGSNIGDSATLHIPYLSMSREESKKLDIDVPTDYSTLKTDMSLETSLGKIKVTEVTRTKGGFTEGESTDTAKIKFEFEDKDSNMRLTSFGYQYNEKYSSYAQQFDEKSGRLTYLELEVGKTDDKISLDISDLSYLLLGEYKIPLDIK